MNHEIITKIVKELHNLYESSNPQDISEANKYLENIQTKPEAWYISDALLNCPDLPIFCYFFGSSLLYHKIITDFCQLPEEGPSRTSLRKSLFDLLFHRTFPPMIRKKLAQACAALFLHMENWKDIMGLLEHQINLNSNNNNNEMCLYTVLLLLEALPNELHNNRLHLCPTRRRCFGLDLCDSISSIVQFIFSLHFDQELVLQTFLSWSHCVCIPIEEIIGLEVVPKAMHLLISDQSQETVTNVICDIFEAHSGCDTSQSIYQLLSPLVSHREHLEHVLRDGDGACDYDSNPSLASWVTILCTLAISLPDVVSHSKEILEMLSLLSHALAHGEGSMFEPLQQIFDALNTLPSTPLTIVHFAPLIDIILHSLKHTDSLDDENDLKSFRRNYCVPLFRRCVDHCGVDSFLVSRLFPILFTSNKTVEIESHLYALRILRRSVSDNHNPLVCRALQRCTSFSQPSFLVYTALLVISSYSDRLSDNSTILSSVFTFVTTHLTQAPIAPAASIAFRHLCSDNTAAMRAQLPQLLNFVISLLAIPSQPHKDVLLGISAIIKTLQTQEARDEAILALAAPLQRALQANHLTAIALHLLKALPMSRNTSNILWNTTLQHTLSLAPGETCSCLSAFLSSFDPLHHSDLATSLVRCYIESFHYKCLALLAHLIHESPELCVPSIVPVIHASLEAFNDHEKIHLFTRQILELFEVARLLLMHNSLPPQFFPWSLGVFDVVYDSRCLSPLFSFYLQFFDSFLPPLPDLHIFTHLSFRHILHTPLRHHLIKKLARVLFLLKNRCNQVDLFSQALTTLHIFQSPTSLSSFVEKLTRQKNLDDFYHVISEICFHQNKKSSPAF